MMLWVGVVVLLAGVFCAAFKCWIVWNIAHDMYNGGGAPTLDFPVFCPIPIAVGGSLTLSALNTLPFPAFGFALYVGLAVCFGALMWWFYIVGEPERQRQLAAIQHQAAAEQKHGRSEAAPDGHGV